MNYADLIQFDPIETVVQLREQDSGSHGLYEPNRLRRKLGSAVALLLVEALLLDAEETAVPLNQLMGHPALFSFDLDLNASHVRSASQFGIHREGLASDFVEMQGGRA